MAKSAQQAALWLVLILHLTSVTPLSAAPQTASAQPAAENAKVAQAAPETHAERIAIICVNVLDDEPMFKVVQRIRTPKNSSAVNKSDGLLDCVPADRPHGQPLIGTGDVVVSVALNDKAALTAPALKPLELFINGVPLGDDATLVATEDSTNQRHFRYYVGSGALSNNLWSALFREGGFYKGLPLRVGLGWSGVPHSFPLDDAFLGNTIQISHLGRLIIASALIVAFIGAWIYVIRTTDTFRDPSPPPAYWQRALLVRRAYRETTDKNTFLKRFESSFDPAKVTDYDWEAERALDGAVALPDKEAAAALGLVRSAESWVAPRASYSLGRVQFGLWLLFAVSVGVFLWVVYGDLPGLDSSIITILAFSTAVTAASLYVDQQAKDRPFSTSLGFWRDITTGFDEKQKVYRFQAVVVNLLLLFIGVYQVINQLTYPTFDPTWLALIGLSGVFLTAGKSLTEVSAPPATATGQTPAQRPSPAASAADVRPASTNVSDIQDPGWAIDGCDVEVLDATPDEALPAATGGIRK